MQGRISGTPIETAVNGLLTGVALGAALSYSVGLPIVKTALKTGVMAVGCLLLSRYIHNELIVPICQKYDLKSATCELICECSTHVISTAAVVGLFALGILPSQAFVARWAVSEALLLTTAFLHFIRDRRAVHNALA